jgi:hypothetical protein
MTRHLRSTLALALTIVAGIGGCDTDEPFSDDLPVKTERGRRGKADGELAPAAWECSASYYGTDDGCDCGCGVVDPDCDSGSAAVCDYEWCTSGDPQPTHNWQCAGQGGGGGGSGAPGSWTCNASYYDGNDGCDCGCGIADPDCASSSASACDYEFCDWDEDVVATNNAQCSSLGGGGGDGGGGGGGGGSSAGQECDDIHDCGVGYTCRYDYQGDPEHGTELLCRWEGLFDPEYCETYYGHNRDCYGSECLGSVHCGVGESCTHVAGTTAPNTQTECTPYPGYDG